MRWLRSSACPASLIEVRVDALLQQGVSSEQLEEALKARRQPVLLTLRIREEGGQYDWRARERRNLFLRLLPHAEAIDLELAAAGRLRSVLTEGRHLKKKIILSAHSIRRSATDRVIQRWCKAFFLHRVQIYKVASRIKTKNDLHRLIRLLTDHPDRRWAVMGVGPQAAASRRLLCELGSRLVYGYLDVAAAPGQPALRDIKKALKSRSI